MIGARADDPWFAEFERDLARTTRRDETALAARISVLEQECERLRQRIMALECTTIERGGRP